MYRGFIKLWRKSLDSPVWKNEDLWRFWTWCLLKASHKDKIQMVGYTEVELKKGDFVFGRHKASEETGLSERKIRTCLSKLKKMQNLTIETTNQYSVVSIANWPEYQDDTTSEATSKRPASDQQATTNKNVKNDKNDKKEHYTNAFELFWGEYPRKTGKGKARESFLKIKPSLELTDKIITAVQNQKKSEQWLREKGQFIPHPATWLNQERWDDEIEGTPVLPLPEKECEEI